MTRADEMGVEIQFARDGDNPGLDKHTFHIRCYAAWGSSGGDTTTRSHLDAALLNQG